MNVAEARGRAAFVAEAATYDLALAHSLQHKLYRDVLRDLAAGACEDPVGVASAALETQTLKLGRVAP